MKYIPIKDKYLFGLLGVVSFLIISWVLYVLKSSSPEFNKKNVLGDERIILSDSSIVSIENLQSVEFVSPQGKQIVMVVEECDPRFYKESVCFGSGRTLLKNTKAFIKIYSLVSSDDQSLFGVTLIRATSSRLFTVTFRNKDANSVFHDEYQFFIGKIYSYFSLR